MRLDIDESQLPGESAYLAIKAYDVDEEYGKVDIVYWNGTEIGRLSGTNNTWNTTVLEVPMDLIQSGADYVEITISKGWVVQVDRVQLLLDGDEKNDSLRSFSMELGTPGSILDQQGKFAGISLPVYMQIETQGNQQYATEYSLVDLKGNTISAAFGQVSGSRSLTDQALLNFPGDMEIGTYQMVGLLKNPENEQILARDQAAWYYAGKDAVPRKRPGLNLHSHPLERL